MYPTTSPTTSPMNSAVGSRSTASAAPPTVLSTRRAKPSSMPHLRRATLTPRGPVSSTTAGSCAMPRNDASSGLHGESEEDSDEHEEEVVAPARGGEGAGAKAGDGTEDPPERGRVAGAGRAHRP